MATKNKDYSGIALVPKLDASAKETGNKYLQKHSKLAAGFEASLDKLMDGIKSEWPSSLVIDIKNGNPGKTMLADAEQFLKDAVVRRCKDDKSDYKNLFLMLLGASQHMQMAIEENQQFANSRHYLSQLKKIERRIDSQIHLLKIVPLLQQPEKPPVTSSRALKLLVYCPHA